MRLSNRIFKRSCLFKELAPGDTFMHRGDVYIKAMFAPRIGETTRYFAVRLRDGVSVCDWGDNPILEPLKLEAIPLIDTDDINK